MAGRGHEATIPAWMAEGASPRAPGAPKPDPNGPAGPSAAGIGQCWLLGSDFGVGST